MHNLINTVKKVSTRIFCIRGQTHPLTFNQCLIFCLIGANYQVYSNDEFDLWPQVSDSGPNRQKVHQNGDNY